MQKSKGFDACIPGEGGRGEGGVCATARVEGRPGSEIRGYRMLRMFPLDPFIGEITGAAINISAKRRAGAIALRDTI